MTIKRGVFNQNDVLNNSYKIDFAISPFDVSYVSQLKNYVDFFKVASGDINN